MNLLAMTDQMTALLLAGAGLLSSIALAFLAFQKGSNGKQSLREEVPSVLPMGSTEQPETHSKRAA